MDFNIQRCGMKDDCRKLSIDFKLVSFCLAQQSSEAAILRKENAELKIIIEKQKTEYNEILEPQFVNKIEQLKSKLKVAVEALAYYADRESYVEDQEFHTIDSLNNDDEFIEKYQARVGGKKARQALKEIES
jgi:hypothetical protein